jgi:hypothetical protein
MLQAADPVYRLVAGDGLGAKEKLEIGKWAARLDYPDLRLRPKP